MLEGARVPVSSGEVWSGAGAVFAKMAGSPRAGIAAGGRVRLVAGGRGVDAIATAAPGDDVAIDAELELSGESAIVVRAIATPAGFKGVALVLDATSSPLRASIRAWDDAGKLTELAPPVDVPPGERYAVKMTVQGRRLEAKVASVALYARVPVALEHGDVAIAAKHGGELDARGFAVRKP